MPMDANMIYIISFLTPEESKLNRLRKLSLVCSSYDIVDLLHPLNFNNTIRQS